jgi:hypothetical protein
MEGIFKKVNFICVCEQVSVCCNEKKKKEEQNLLYQRERSIRPREEKHIQARKILNSKVLKLGLLFGKVPSHF